MLISDSLGILRLPRYKTSAEFCAGFHGSRMTPKCENVAGFTQLLFEDWRSLWSLWPICECHISSAVNALYTVGCHPKPGSPLFSSAQLRPEIFTTPSCNAARFFICLPPCPKLPDLLLPSKAMGLQKSFLLFDTQILVLISVASLVSKCSFKKTYLKVAGDLVGPERAPLG